MGAFRENTQPPDSDLLVEMRRSLSVLRTAAGAEPQDQAAAQIRSKQDDEDVEDDCEEDPKEKAEVPVPEVPAKTRSSLLTAPTEQGTGLRPAWATGRQQPKQQLRRPQQQQQQQQQEVPDSWDT